MLISLMMKDNETNVTLKQESPNFFMVGHVADTLKTREPKLTRSRRKLTVNNVGDRVL